MKYINILVILPKQVGILAEMVPESPLNRELLIHI